MRRRVNGRLGDAQGEAGHGRFLLVTFLSRERKVTSNFGKGTGSVELLRAFNT
jgi:hypothetical protein